MIEELQEEKLNGYVEILNEERKKFLLRFVLVVLLAIVILIIAIPLFWIKMNQISNNNTDTDSAYLFGIAAIVSPLLFCYATLNALKVKQRYINIFKAEIMPTIVRDVNPTLKFKPDNGILNKIYNKSYLNIPYNVYSSEDLINGYIQEAYIECAEIDARLIEREKHTGHEITKKVFIGLFAMVELPKNINNTIQVKSDEIIKLNPDLNVRMDSSEFEKIFDVNTTDKIVAMQIITSDVIEIILNFLKETKIPIQLCIVDNILYMTFETGPIYEANIFADNKSNVNKYYKTTKFVMELIEKILKAINETSI